MERITVNPEQCGGRCCMRGMQIRVIDVLDLFAAGLSPEQVLEGMPDLDHFLPIRVGLALWLYPSLCLYLIVGKTRADDAWMAWVPILNIYLICKIGDQSGFWVLLGLIPFVAQILSWVVRRQGFFLHNQAM